MDDPGRVGLRQPLSHLRGDVDGVVHRQRPPCDPLLERLALVVRHHEVELSGAVSGLVDLVDRADVGVVQRRGGLRLQEEALLRRGFTDQIRGKNFDGHLPVEPGILRPVDDAHPAPAELGRDLVGTDRRTRNQGHRRDVAAARRDGYRSWARAPVRRFVMP